MSARDMDLYSRALFALICMISFRPLFVHPFSCQCSPLSCNPQTPNLNLSEYKLYPQKLYNQIHSPILRMKISNYQELDFAGQTVKALNLQTLYSLIRFSSRLEISSDSNLKFSRPLYPLIEVRHVTIEVLNRFVDASTTNLPLESRSWGA